MRNWLVMTAALAALALVLAISAAPGPTGAAASAPADACPDVPNTPNFTLANGEVQLGGAAAPAGTIVAALSPRGDVVGCFEVGAAGHYGAMYIYGEDTSASPAIPGMRDGETVSFRVTGLPATAAPALVWHNDWATHAIALAAWPPTPTPTPTLTPTPTSTPTAISRPDLSVKSIQIAPAAPVVGQALAVTVVIQNLGSAAAAGLFYTDAYADHVPAGCDDLGWDYAETAVLASGGEASLSFTHPGFSTTGTHFIRAFVDSSCQISEADEANNIGLLRVTVGVPLPPVIPVVTATRSGSAVVLTWPHASSNASYQVWRGTNPNFALNSGGSTSIVGDGATGNCTNNGVTVTCTNANASGNPDINYFYQVRAFNAGGTSADSKRVGEFDFGLVPGGS